MSARADSLVGSLLGKDYRVLEQIGVGGMAVVYLVEHQTLLKKFAAKVLSSEHAASAEARARFTQEAHAASQLDHENIVTISDFGVTPDERPFFVMELLRGQTLADRLEDGPMTIEEIVAVSVPVARALAHAHAEDIIHRDVKPENIFLVQRSQGRWGVKVLDFGIAKVPVNAHLTKMGQALGSPMYMAPEACRGDDVDQRADIYSFGIILYLMLTGRVPFFDESLLKILQMQVSAPLPPPREINPQLSPELEAVVVRTLAKDPDERYASMDELLIDLEAALPQGSDALLIQAQFGTALSNTPFPGTLERVRNSQRMALPPGISITGEHKSTRPSITGEHKATKQAAPAPTSLPAAPQKRGRGAIIALGTLGLLAAAGAGAYAFMQSSSKPAGPTAAPVAAAEPATVQVAAPAPAAAPPVGPRVVGPAEPSVPVEPAVPVEVATPSKPDERPAVDPDASKKSSKIKSSTKSVAAVKTPPRETPGAKNPSSGSGSAAIAVTPVTPVIKEPTPVTPKPVVTPPTKPLPTPVVVAPPPRPVAPKVEVGSLDATPVIASLDVNGPLPSSVVRRGVERSLPALRECYRTAAKARKQTPSVKLSVSFEVDENSAATSVSARGTNFGTLDSCARGAISRIQTQQAPDVGTVHVVVAISFRPV